MLLLVVIVIVRKAAIARNRHISHQRDFVAQSCIESTRHGVKQS
jgi:hypothetical protein